MQRNRPDLILFADVPTGDGFADRLAVTICHGCARTRPKAKLVRAWVRAHVAAGNGIS
jgi:hypothetical protein